MQPAKSSDWQTKPLPARRTTVRLDRYFSEAEMQRIRNGLVPEEMENKWFIYWQDQSLFFHRSWTGICIYVVRFVPERDGWRMGEADVNRDAEQYGETRDETDAKMVSYLIDVLLLGQQASFPIDDPSPGKKALMMWSLVGDAVFSDQAPKGGNDAEPQRQP